MSGLAIKKNPTLIQKFEFFLVAKKLIKSFKNSQDSKFKLSLPEHHIWAAASESPD